MLNDRDILILTMIAQGYTSQQIGDKIGRTRETVENITYKMRQSFEVDSKIALVMIALDKGIIKLEDVVKGIKHIDGVTKKFERFKAVYSNKQYV